MPQNRKKRLKYDKNCLLSSQLPDLKPNNLKNFFIDQNSQKLNKKSPVSTEFF